MNEQLAADKDVSMVAVPFWALDEAIPAMLGALELYKQMQAAKMQTALEIDLVRFTEAIEVIASAMEVVHPFFDDAETSPAS
jgi:hypothetical protein